MTDANRPCPEPQQPSKSALELVDKVFGVLGHGTSRDLGPGAVLVDQYVADRLAQSQREVTQPTESEFGNLKTAQDVAYRIFAEITVIPADAQAAKVIALISQAVAQARVDEAKWWHGRGKPHLEGHDCQMVVEKAVSFSNATVEECKHMIALERDLAAIAKGPHHE